MVLLASLDHNKGIIVVFCCLASGLALNIRNSQKHTMSKLIERDSASGGSSLAKAPALAVQFFVIPLAVVGMVVLVYGGFRLLLTTERTPEEFLQDVQTGGRERRWPAAYELSRLISDPDVESRYPTLGASIVELSLIHISEPTRPY